MTTSFSESTDMIMSPKEAEAVFELWAKRQSEGEILRQRMSVQDMAEAMSIPPSEVEQMLSFVRSANMAPHEPTKIKKARPINSFLITVVAVTWFVILIGSSFLFYYLGHRNGLRANLFARPGPVAEMAMAPPNPPYSSAGTAVTYSAQANLADQIPDGVSVEFNNYRVTGDNSGGFLSEDDVMTALNSIIQKVASPSSVIATTKLTEVEIVEAIQNRNAEKLSGLVRFQTITISQGKSTFQQPIPVAQVKDPRIVRLVGEEQTRLLRILANNALRFGRSMDAPQPTR
ncbi:MAG: hypothetical protein IT203_00985 [Fimbriimonadaceae bacterium]|nr:hypothetical protein [Fimbriimonadaceae bacterium]